jgi:hypothetical protein
MTGAKYTEQSGMTDANFNTIRHKRGEHGLARNALGRGAVSDRSDVNGCIYQEDANRFFRKVLYLFSSSPSGMPLIDL